MRNANKKTNKGEHIMKFTRNDINKITLEMAQTTFDENGFIVEEDKLCGRCGKSELAHQLSYIEEVGATDCGNFVE